MGSGADERYNMSAIVQNAHKIGMFVNNSSFDKVLVN